MHVYLCVEHSNHPKCNERNVFKAWFCRRFRVSIAQQEYSRRRAGGKKFYIVINSFVERGCQGSDKGP